MSAYTPDPLIPVYFENHKSSQLNPDFISAYIRDEQAAGRYSSGYPPDELEALIGPFQTSPLGLVPKPHSDSLRLVQDMSYPRNNASIPSVNAGVNSDDFPTAWGTFDSTAALIVALPEGCVAATFDISAAYRLTPIRPDQQHMVCIRWDGLVYVDRAVMFGLSSSAGVFGSIADMLVAIYTRSGFGPIRKWVDDFFVIRLPDQSWSEEEFMQLTEDIGVPWSRKKTRSFATVQRYIGFDWDLKSRSVSLPTDKFLAAQELLKQWLVRDAIFSASDAASLHGKLVHISCIFKLIRPFLRSASAFAASFHSPRARLHAPPSLIADLSWITFLLHKLPPSLPLRAPTPIDIDWWGDASTSFGVGVVIGQHYAVWRWSNGFHVGPKTPFDIGWAEAVAIELGLRTAASLDIFRNQDGCIFLVHSDNDGIVAVINRGRSRSRETNRILKEIYLLLAVHRIHLSAVYVPSRSNVSDALSRGDIPTFLRGFPSASTQWSIPLPPHLSGKLTSL